jgi:hypothetical protein
MAVQDTFPLEAGNLAPLHLSGSKSRAVTQATFSASPMETFLIARGQMRQSHVRQERVLWRGRPAWRSFSGRWAIMGWLLGIGAAYPELQEGLWAAAGILVLTILATRLRHAYTVTSHRVIEQEGLFVKDIYESRINDIVCIHLHQSFLERLLGVRTLVLNSAANGEIGMMFGRVAAPTKVHALIRRFR